MTARPERLSTTCLAYLSAVDTTPVKRCAKCDVALFDPRLAADERELCGFCAGDTAEAPCETCGEVGPHALTCGAFDETPVSRQQAAAEDSHYERINLELTASWSER